MSGRKIGGGCWTARVEQRVASGEDVVVRRDTVGSHAMRCDAMRCGSVRRGAVLRRFR